MRSGHGGGLHADTDQKISVSLKFDMSFRLSGSIVNVKMLVVRFITFRLKESEKNVRNISCTYRMHWMVLLTK
jgi:hypothetical protein